jgi:competence protein ComEA
MVWSLLIRLGMFASTMGVILWIGWTVPESYDGDRSQITGTPHVATSETIASVDNGRDDRQASQRTSALHAGSSSWAQSAVAIDLNRATEQELEALPGIGSVLAERIVAHRVETGPFKRVEDLRAVKGIGKKTFEKIRPMLNVTRPAIGHRELKKTI